MKIKIGLIGLVFVLGIIFSLNIILAEESITETQFYNSFDYPYCYAESNILSWWVEDGEWERGCRN